MPGTITAIFYQRMSRPESVSAARKAHSALLRQFGLNARKVPLVVYDERSDVPFMLDESVHSELVS